MRVTRRDKVSEKWRVSKREGERKRNEHKKNDEEKNRENKAKKISAEWVVIYQ